MNQPKSGFTPTPENGVVSKAFSVGISLGKRSEKLFYFCSIFKRHNKNASPFFGAGFTLIEVIVVVAVIGFLSASMLSTQKSSSARRQLGLDVQRAVQDLRNAQNLALSSQISADCGNKVVPYGIVFNTTLPDRYFLAADCSNPKNNTYDADAGDAIVQTVFFPESRISSLQAEGGVVSSLQVFFAPPLPTVFINGSASVSAVSAGVKICHFVQTALCKTINISSKGAISTQ